MRKQVEYEVQRACGALEGEEELDYEVKVDDCTRAKADEMLSRNVRRVNEEGEEHVGLVVQALYPDADDHDQRTYFDVQFDEGSERLSFDELQSEIAEN